MSEASEDNLPEYGILIRKSIFELNQSINVDFKGLFKATGKAIVDAHVGSWDRFGKDLIDGFTSLGKNQGLENTAWLLIYRGLARAIRNLVKDNSSWFQEDYRNYDSINKSIEQELNFSFEQKEVIIGQDFFLHPEELLEIVDITTPLLQWVQYYGLNATQATNLCRRFPSYFIFALNEEWTVKSKDYLLIKHYFETVFYNATKLEGSRLFYKSYLQQQVDKPVFDETFSLRQIYTPLRAYYQQKIESRDNYYKDKDEYKKIVVELEPLLLDWIERDDKDDALRIISGDPGSGKSSFVKMLAAKLAQMDVYLFFIPLHIFQVKDDLIAAVNNFISRQTYFDDNFSLQGFSYKKVLLIFDGLDELSKQGNMGKKVAKSFIDEVQSQLTKFNFDETKLQVIISGRPVSISSNEDNLRDKKQILHLLPYYIPGNRREQYEDQNNLLEEDQRNKWWQKYSELIGENYQALPNQLSSSNLEEITKQPLLNYLISLSYQKSKDPAVPNEDKVDFSKNPNLNIIYGDLLISVFERKWDTAREHPTTKDVAKKQFCRILEEIALISWFGNGRTTTVSEMETHCEQNNLKAILDDFKKGAEEGVTNLLTAFYFRQSGYAKSGDPTFEFTHKSFREFLTARRILRELIKINKKLREEELDDRWDEKTALVHWAEICGKSTIDDYLLDFIRDEIALQKTNLVQEWQETLSQLIGYMLCQGMPMERIESCSTYKEAIRQARNAEEALLVALSSCARKTQKVSSIQWQSKEYSFRQWLLRLQNCIDYRSLVTEQSLSYLDLSKADLSNVDLSEANFSNADLSDADLRNADLSYADLSEANLSYTLLRYTNLSNADLSDANLSYASLVKADLDDADLSKADLSYANLDDADLSKADLSNTDLRGVDLRGADLSDADLSEANLSDTDLSDTDLSYAELSYAKNLTPVQIKSAQSWEQAIYKVRWDNKLKTWVVDQEANEQFIAELKSEL